MSEPGSIVPAAGIPTVKPIPGASVGMLRGGDHGIDLSLIFGDWPPGTGPGPHRHPRGSAICVIEGRGVFTVNGEEFPAEAGDVLIVPARAWHTFTNTGHGPLRTIAADEGADLGVEFPEEPDGN